MFRLENGKITKLTLPSTLVTIGNGAFQGHALTSVDIPASVTSIGDNAFADNAIAAINLPDGLSFLGARAFKNNLLGSVAIPAGLTEIYYETFQNNQITSVTFSSGLVTIGDNAFSYNQIENLELPVGLETIYSFAFYENEIQNLLLPSGLQSIEWAAFQSNEIISVTIPNSVTQLDGNAFYDNNISTLNFEAGSLLTQISMGCFQNNDLRNITIPDNVLEIHDQAFYDNPNLTNVTFNSNLLRIKMWAFGNCNLSAPSLPESLVFVDQYVFANNSSLSSFLLPVSSNDYTWNDSEGDKHNEGANITDFERSYIARIEYTFQPGDLVIDADGYITQCTYFDDITNTGSVITIPNQLDGIDIVGISGGAFYDTGISELIISEGIESIGNGAFQNNEIVSVTIPNTVTLIDDWAFSDNYIKTLLFEATSTLERIGDGAFSRNKLENVEIPASVAKIGESAFSDNRLENVTFETNSQLVSIASYAFMGNWDLPSITLPDPGNTPYSDHWVDWNNNEFSINREVTNFETFYKIPIEYTLTDDDVEVVDGVIISYSPADPYVNIITIPDSIDGQEIIGIDNYVFNGMDLIGVNLPPSLKTIGKWAFGDNELLEIFIPHTVEEIQAGAFSQNNITAITFEENSSLRLIEWDGFSSNKITELTLPDSVNYIGNSAFNGNWITDLTLSDSLGYIGSYAFAGNAITDLTLTDSINYIGEYAFAWNQISNELIIPDGLESIDYGAFSSNQIPSVIFTQNSGLTYLGGEAFAYNEISNEIFIPYGITEILPYAFQGNNISKVQSHENIIEYGYRAFWENDPGLEIELHEPPTIPLVTYFFWWKDNNGNYYDPGEIISNTGSLNFDNFYKAVVDEFFVVTFVVTDDNNVPLENANIKFHNEFFDENLTTDVNGIDSIGPVLRGFWEIEVTGIAGCIDYYGTIDVQDDMEVNIVLTRYYNVNVNVAKASDDSPIPGANIIVGDVTTISDSDGNAKLSLSDGEYPSTINVAGYKTYSDLIAIQDADTTIFVKLTPVEINYFANDGTSDSYSVTGDGSTYTTDLNTTTREGYAFSHWNTNIDNSGVSYTENELINLEYADVDLYATWTPLEYNITYNLDGGTNDAGNPATYTIESDITFLPATKPALYFAAWIDVNGDRVSRIELGSTGDVELWAVFTPEPTYYIDYHNLENASHNNILTYTQFDLPFTFEDAYKRGYEFIAWHEDLSLTNPIATIPTGSEVDYDIYAEWGNAIEYTINYEVGGGVNSIINPLTYNIESDVIRFEDPAKVGGKFVGWYIDDLFTTEITEITQGSVGDTTLYAQWDLETFAIQYVLDGGANNLANPDIYNIDSDILFESPAKIGSNFMGWYNDSGLTSEISGIPIGNYGDTVIYARWELDTFAVEYELYGGQNHISNPFTYTIESTNILFEIPTKTGANFIGWYIDNAYTQGIINIPTGSVGDTILYAQWDLENYDIAYTLNGGINHSANPPIYNIDSDIIRFENPTKLGAKFMGWFIESGFITEIFEIPEGSTGDTSVYAQWELDTFAIQYELDGGENAIANPSIYTIESADILFENPTKLGAKFMGWFSDNGFTQEITEISTGNYGDTTLYAQWEIETYNILYELDGGNNSATNPIEYTIESNTIVFEAPEKPGFYFDGWFASTTLASPISEIAQGSVGDITLYAKWREIFTVNFVITTDGKNPAREVDIVINYNDTLYSDEFGLADTLVADGSEFNYSVEIDGIEIDYGKVVVAGSDVTVEVEIVDCYMRWYDVIFCDNGKGLWAGFVWYKEGKILTIEQFFHNPGGIEDGLYRLVVRSIAGIEYIWEKEYQTDVFAVNLYPNPVTKSGHLNVDISGKVNLTNSTIYIHSVTGALIKTIHNPASTNHIAIDSDFSPGLYHMILVENNKRREVKEFIVK